MNDAKILWIAMKWSESRQESSAQWQKKWRRQETDQLKYANEQLLKYSRAFFCPTHLPACACVCVFVRVPEVSTRNWRIVSHILIVITHLLKHAPSWSSSMLIHCHISSHPKFLITITNKPKDIATERHVTQKQSKTTTTKKHNLLKVFNRLP